MKNSLPILTKKRIVSKDSQLPVKPSWLETDLHYTHMVFYILPSKQNLWEMLSTVNLTTKCHSFSDNGFIEKISNNETENIIPMKIQNCMPSSNVYSTTTSSAEEDDDELLDRVYAALNKRVKTSVSKVPSKQHCGDTSKSLLVSVCKNISTSHNSSAKIKRKNLLSSPPKRLTSKKMRSSTKAIKKWIKY